MLSILFLAADPTNASRLRLGEELREIQEKLQLAKLRDHFSLQQRMSVRSTDLSQALLDLTPDIVHFSGHGMSSGELCFEDVTGKIHPIPPDALADLFEQFASQVKCVILNACYSELQAKAIAKHVGYVVGMNREIGDRAAIAFTIGFYQALGAGRAIDEAYKLGCVQIKLQGIPEALTPVLIKKDRSVERQIKPHSLGKDLPQGIELEQVFPNLVTIPSGVFIMGDGNSTHELYLPEFRIGKYPVTNQEYRYFLKVLGSKSKIYHEDTPETSSRLPVVNVSWYDAIAYCDWLSAVTGVKFGLPTEAEWEKAARGTDGRRYPWGNDFSIGLCNSAESSVGHPSDIGLYSPAGDSPYGLADMVGNVWEWCNTRWCDQNDIEYPFPYTTNDEREVFSRDDRIGRVMKGGAYHSPKELVTCFSRRPNPPYISSNYVGFRVVVRSDYGS